MPQHRSRAPLRTAGYRPGPLLHARAVAARIDHVFWVYEKEL
jgi:hypothetical protein